MNYHCLIASQEVFHSYEISQPKPQGASGCIEIELDPSRYFGGVYAHPDGVQLMITLIGEQEMMDYSAGDDIEIFNGEGGYLNVEFVEVLAEGVSFSAVIKSS